MKKIFYLLSLVGLVLTSCGDPSVDTSSSSSSSLDETTSSSETSQDTSTSTMPQIDLEKLLLELQDDDFAQTGTLEVDVTTQDGTYLSGYVQTATSYHDGDTFYLTLKDENGELAYNPLEKYKNEDGYAVNRYLNYDNTFIDLIEYTDAFTPVDFDTYYGNPFAQMTLDNLEQISETEVEVSNIDDFRDDLVYGLTGYEDIPVISFILTVEDDTISGVAIGEEEYTETVGGAEIQIIASAQYSFEIIAQEEVDFEEITTLPLLEEHAPLTALFDSLKNNNYQVDVTRTGGSVSTLETEFKIYSHPSYLLREYTQETIGMYQDDNGLHDVALEDGVLKGTAYPVADLTLNMFRSDFELSPALFDVNADGSFTLKSQFNGSFAMHGCVDFTYNYQGYLANLTPSTYKIVIDENGATFDYDYSYVDTYGNIISGHVTCVVSNIGQLTTYTFEPYEEVTYEKWSDFGSDISTLLTKYLGENFDDLLPFINYLDYPNSNNKNISETTYGGRTYAQLSIVDNNNTADAILADYQDKLVAIGWTNTEGNVWTIEKEDGNGYYHLEVYTASNRYFYLRLYQQGTNSLSEYLNRYFSSSNNATIELTHTKTYYNYDSASGTQGDVHQSETTTNTYYFTDTAVRQIKDGGSEMYFVHDENDNFIIYTQLSTGEFDVLTSSSGQYDVSTYPSYGTIAPSNIVSYASYLTYVEGSDGHFTYVDNPTMPTIYIASTIASVFFGESLSTSYSYLECSVDLYIDFVTNQVTLEVSAKRVSGNYIIEDVFEAHYTNIGNTRVDNSTLPPLE